MIFVILAILGCGDCVFLGVMSQTFLITFSPSFYGWGIAFYVAAGFFGVWGAFELIRLIALKPRRKRAAGHTRTRRRNNHKPRKRKGKKK